MLRNAARDLFDLLTQAPSLPPESLSAALAVAERTGDDVLLRKVVSREYTPEDLIAGYATDPRTNIAYQARTNRTRGPREHRASVLTRALGRGGVVAPEVLADTLAAFDARPGVGLAGALHKHADPKWLTPSQITNVMLMADNGQKALDHQWARRLGRDGSVKLLENVKNARWLTTLVHYPVPLEVFTEAVKDLAARALFKPSKWVRSREEAILAEVLVDLRTFHDTSTAPMRALYEDTRWVEERRPTHSDEISTMLTAAARTVPTGPVRTLQEWDTTPANPPRVDDLSGLPQKALVAPASSTDPQTLAAVVDELLSRGTAWNAAEPATTLLFNPALRVQDRHRLVGALRPGELELHRDDSFDKLDLVAMFPDDPVTIRAWAMARRTHTLSRYGWGPFGGTAAAPGLLAQWRDELREAPATWRSVLEHLRPADLTTDQLRVLEPRTLRWVAAFSDGELVVARLLQQLLTEHLGTEATKWETFLYLLDAHTGPIGEILELSETVGATPAA